MSERLRVLLGAVSRNLPLFTRNSLGCDTTCFWAIALAVRAHFLGKVAIR